MTANQPPIDPSTDPPTDPLTDSSTDPSTDTDEYGPASDPWAGLEKAAAASPTGKIKVGKRERVVLAKRRSSRRVVRTLAELEDQTGVGEVLVRQLVRVQLNLALRLMLLIVVALGTIPMVFALAPSLSTISVLGVLRLPWLLLGPAVYLFFIAVAWVYNRSADRIEQDFVEMVEN
jgi:hypothetical protein